MINVTAKSKIDLFTAMMVGILPMTTMTPVSKANVKPAQKEAESKPVAEEEKKVDTKEEKPKKKKKVKKVNNLMEILSACT